MTKKSLAIVTGGSRGIGNHVVRLLLRDMDVLNISRSPAQESGELGPSLLHNLLFDLQDIHGIGPALKSWLRDNVAYCVRYLIHNAAVLNLGWLDTVTPEHINQSFQVNIHAPLALTNTVYACRRFALDEVRVLYVTSSLARPLPELSFAGIGLYSLTKAALSRMALIQAREFSLKAPHIKVVRLHPGIVETDMQKDLRCSRALDPEFEKKTAGLPFYREGEWQGKSPLDHMRTISAEFAAQFILWVAKRSRMERDEYDFYATEEFHSSLGEKEMC